MGQGDCPLPHNSDSSMSGSLDKEPDTIGVGAADGSEVVRTVSKVPGNTNYYEKDGLRTYGDDEDHEHEPPVRIQVPTFYIEKFE